MADTLDPAVNCDFLDDPEIEDLMDMVYRTYGYDFRNYARASRRRRVLAFLHSARLHSVAEARRVLKNDRTLFADFLGSLTVPTTELFRDPAFYRDFIRKVVPVLRSYASLKIWHAGCSTGEEVYSMVILLHEQGLLDRATIYATDIDRDAVETARKGIVSTQVLRRDARQYFDAGLELSLSHYWCTRHGYALLDPALLENVVFSSHNLATDAAFGEMNVVLCRNVLIYFDRSLQDRVLSLFVASLARAGFLCLGKTESTAFSSIDAALVRVSPETRIYRRKLRW